ncbi:MAG: transaldolase [Actinomycetota bacterium]
MTSIKDLNVRIFADGADRADMLSLYANPIIKGFTTNPTLMRKAGVTDYEAFARDILEVINDRPISFEVFADEQEEMGRQARYISSWGDNVYVKIPVTTTAGEPMTDLIAKLAADGVKQNVTALMTPQQVEDVSQVLAFGPSSFISVFAGRIADTGRDPVPLMKECLQVMKPHKNIELIWASPRELLNIFQANEIGCHVITATKDVLNKLDLVGLDLNDYSLDTVRMFFDDALRAGFDLNPDEDLAFERAQGF